MECIPQCCKDKPAKFPPTTCGQYLLDKFAAMHADYSGIVKVMEG